MRALLMLLGLLSQQVYPVPPQPPRDTVRRAEASGTASIRGRVVTADTGQPVRRASVTLSYSPPPRVSPPTSSANATRDTAISQSAMASMARDTMAQMFRPRQATTDSQGAFEFTALPAGSYRLAAFPGPFVAQYVGIPYGAKRSMYDPGLPIQLADGTVFDKAIIALPRGGVITGRVVDDDGGPLARVQVYGLFFPPGSTRGQRNNGGAMTDDLGQFRIYGLQPGEYAIVAEARMPTFVSPSLDLQPEREDDRLGFMTTFYPGSPDEASAQHIRAAAGAETTGIEIRLLSGRLLRVSGIVSDSQGKPMPNANGQIARRSPGSGMSSYGFSTDGQGKFQMRNVAPGEYRILVRQRPMMFGGDGTTSDPGEMASVPLTLVDSDAENLAIVTSPGATVRGQVIFEPVPPTQMPREVRITAVSSDQDGGMGLNPGGALLQPDLTFTLKGVVGEYLLRAGAPGFYLKSVSIVAADITDTPHEFTSRERVTIVLTSRASTLEGAVTDAAGAPSTEVAIIVFSEDKSGWRSNSIRTRRGGPDPNGHFQITGLLPGRYYILAAPRERLNLPPSLSPAFFEGLAKDALAIVVGEDEQRTVDLKVVGGGL